MCSNPKGFVCQNRFGWLIGGWLLLSCLLLASWLNRGYGQRVYGGYYSKEKLANARRNSQQFDWAREKREQAVTAAAPWVGLADTVLWQMVPGQELPRCIDVSFDRLAFTGKKSGCLQCGDSILAFGAYPYTLDFAKTPWKITCPSCHRVFPTNDFGTYYQSGINSQGVFDSARADRSLLFNEQHPDPADPLHLWGVDDGYGYHDAAGTPFRFIGYYTWQYWNHLIAGLSSLADAYVYTGERRYAHKAAVLLDRLADVYPTLDWAPLAAKGWFHSDGGSNKGKIGGSIWETNLSQTMASAYDKILSGTVGDANLFSFLQGQARKYHLPTKKGSRKWFVNNVDEGLLRCIYKSVLSAQIRGNQGMHQLSLAKAAIALNNGAETNQWLDWLFQPDGGSIPGMMMSRMDHDGSSDEGAPGYAFFWSNLMADMGELLRGYAGYRGPDLFTTYPQLRAGFSTAYRMLLLGKTMPNLGDAGATGLVSTRDVSSDILARGFAIYGDTSLALAAYRANGNRATGLGWQIFAANQTVHDQIEQIGLRHPPRPIESRLLSGFGLALLETGLNKQQVGIAFNYGRTSMHAHPDMLNFDLFAFDHWLTPDHGYPEYASKWPSNQEWTGSSLSHNLVYANRRPQRETWGGKTILFKTIPGFTTAIIDGRAAYPDLTQYERALFLVGGASSTDSNSYVIDVFSVAGGNDYVYSLHGPPAATTNTSLNLQPQSKGTYAGINIAKGALADSFPIGYSYLYDVYRQKNPPLAFSVDWQVKPGYRNLAAGENLHLRLHAFTKLDEVALAAGDPPQNKPGNPTALPYVLMHCSGDSIQQQFVSVIEPYRAMPFIKSIERLPTANKVVALKVLKQDGQKDILVYNPDPSTAARVGDYTVAATVGLFRFSADDRWKEGIVINGRGIGYKQQWIDGQAGFVGKVIDFKKQVSGEAWIRVDQRLPTGDSLRGEIMVIKNNNERDASYTIERVERQGTNSLVYCGPLHFIRDYKAEKIKVRQQVVPASYKNGYLYDFEEGNQFEIAGHVVGSPISMAGQQ